MRYSFFLRCWVVVVLASYVPIALADQPKPETPKIAENRNVEFLRFEENPDGSAQLQTCIMRFVNDSGVTVDLIGAVHIADKDYYDKLNERFKNYDALLYEMVKPKNTDIRQRMRQNEDGVGQSWITMIQKFMKDQLELEFQLDGIDYEAKNFVHADLDAETFAQMQAARGESMFTLLLQEMIKGITNPDNAKMGQGMSMLELLDALQSPDSSRKLKLILGRQFGLLEGNNSMLGGNGSVIVGERNKKALKVLKSEIESGKKNLAIFYGAAHLPGMEEIMVDLMGFKPVGEVEWITAWNIPAQAQNPEETPDAEPAEQTNEIIPV